MEDQEILKHLLGPTGGIFALGIVIGIVATWAVNMKIIAPWVQKAHEARIEAMQARLEALEASFKAQISTMEAAFKSQLSALQSRVTELEVVEEEYTRILKERANLSGTGVSGK